MDSFVLSQHIGISGPLSIFDWPAPDTPPRGRVLLVHGLGEHMGRYAHVAKQLRTWGFAVRGYDQYGHGQSTGPRGDMKNAHSVMADLGCVIDVTRELTLAQDKPLILLGHSMGGLIAGKAVAEALRQVDGLVMSSPALATNMNGFQKTLLRLLPRLAPHLCVDNGLNPQFVARDPQVVQDYLKDPLVHRKISASLAEWLVAQGPQVLAKAAEWTTPTLLMYAGQDQLVAPRGSALFAANAPVCVRSKVFEAMYHEIFNDPEKNLVFDCLRDWLNDHFSA